MQLYAKDEKGCQVLAHHATKQLDYFCIECGAIVRLRGGAHRQNHFFHLDSVRSCHLSGKSMRHLQVQWLLHRLLPQGESQLEYRFDAINRIADLVWFTHRFVFEIQCSPISYREIKQRNSDYQKMGYQVIWIFHDKQFNRWRITAAEQLMRGIPHYFTNIDQEGNGLIYDQFDLVDGGMRKSRMGPLPVDLSKPRYLTHYEKIQLIEGQSGLPREVVKRLQGNQFYFCGDLVEASIARGEYWAKAMASEAEFALKESETEKGVMEWIKLIFQQCIANPYRYLFQMFLEKACQ